MNRLTPIYIYTERKGIGDWSCWLVVQTFEYALIQPSENPTSTILDGSFLEQRREREGGNGDGGSEGGRKEGVREMKGVK